MATAKDFRVLKQAGNESAQKYHTPLMKPVATFVGVALCSVEVWLNAEAIAKVEGWESSMVPAVVVSSIAAACALAFSRKSLAVWAMDENNRTYIFLFSDGDIFFHFIGGSSWLKNG